MLFAQQLLTLTRNQTTPNKRLPLRRREAIRELDVEPRRYLVVEIGLVGRLRIEAVNNERGAHQGGDFEEWVDEDGVCAWDVDGGRPRLVLCYMRHVYLLLCRLRDLRRFLKHCSRGLGLCTVACGLFSSRSFDSPSSRSKLIYISHNAETSSAACYRWRNEPVWLHSWWLR
jgi:hypothetical protein